MKKNHNKPQSPAQSMQPLQSPETDPQGSWTGVPEGPDLEPVQDADDL